MHRTVAQNKAHREDLTWVKVGPSEYMRADGVTIRKSRTQSAWWVVYLPGGEIAQSPDFRNLSASAPSLTIAKWNAESVDSSTPAYLPKGAR